MKPRTPGFTPGRLRLAREAAGLSKADLAALLDLTPAAVGQYESGARTPGPDIVQALSQHLHQPPAFFLKPAPPERTGPVFYRSLKSTEQAARLKAEAKMVYLWDIIDYAEGLLTLPPVNMPPVGQFPDRPEYITEDMIDAAVTVAREHWNMGNMPAPNIVWLLEGSGAVVLRVDLSSDKLEALSEWREADGRPYVMLNTVKRNAFRSRADIAHEIGHLLLHRNVPKEALKDKDTFNLMEAQAWRFAQGFLLPAEPFLRDVYSLSLDALLALKPKWRVSVAFMLQTMLNLEIIDSGKYVNYRKYLAQRGWLRGEPYDAETAPERPMLLRQLVEFLRDQGLHTPDQLVQGLHLNALDIEELTQVEPGFFTTPPSLNIMFTPRKSRTA